MKSLGVLPHVRRGQDIAVPDLEPPFHDTRNRVPTLIDVKRSPTHQAMDVVPHEPRDRLGGCLRHFFGRQRSFRFERRSRGASETEQRDSTSLSWLGSFGHGSVASPSLLRRKSRLPPVQIAEA